MDPNPFDELVQIKDRQQCKGPPRPLRGTRIIIYDDPSEIPALLTSTSLPPDTQTNSDPQPPPTVEPVQPLDSTTPTDDNGAEHLAEDNFDEPASPDEDTGIDHDVDVQEATLSADAERTYIPPAPPTAEELKAARVIGRFYRRVLALRRGAPKKGLAEARTRWFLACHAASQDMGPKYRCLFQGPLPHALVCLEGVSDYAGRAKKSARTRLQKVEHAEYEAVTAELDRVM